MQVKWKSYILLFGLLVFLGETLTIPCAAIDNPKKSTCKMQHAAKGMMMKSCCHKHENKKTTNCNNCPLLYIAVVAPLFTKPDAAATMQKNKYPLFKNKFLSFYCNETWKPPNV